MSVRAADAFVACPNCGHRNSPDANFCSSCGTALGGGGGTSAAGGGTDETTTIVVPLEATAADADDDVSVTLDDLPEGMGLVVVKRGPNAGSRFALEHEVTRVGRSPDSDVFLDDVTVSRRHAEFVRTPGGHLVRDVGSLNGTYVNRARIEEVPLANGDEVQVGKFKLVFLAGTGAPAGPDGAGEPRG